MKKKIIFIVLLMVLVLVVITSLGAGGKWVNSQKAPFYIVNGCSSNVVSNDLAGDQVTLVDPRGNVSMVI